MSQLKPCPCGKVPKKLQVEQFDNWYLVSAMDCDKWQTTMFGYFGEVYEGNILLYEKAIEAWNVAPRAGNG